MKKNIILAAIALSFGLTACNQQNKTKIEASVPEVQEEPADTAFMQANAGEYKSYDGKKSIILKADGTVECKNTKYDYDSWGVMEKNETQAACRLSRKGIDRPITVSVFMDTHEHSIVVDNETFRKAVKKKEK